MKNTKKAVETTIRLQWGLLIIMIILTTTNFVGAVAILVCGSLILGLASIMSGNKSFFVNLKFFFGVIIGIICFLPFGWSYVWPESMTVTIVSVCANLLALALCLLLANSIAKLLSRVS